MITLKTTELHTSKGRILWHVKKENADREQSVRVEQMGPGVPALLVAEPCGTGQVKHPLQAFVSASVQDANTCSRGCYDTN